MSLAITSRPVNRAYCAEIHNPAALIKKVDWIQLNVLPLASHVAAFVSGQIVAIGNPVAVLRIAPEVEKKTSTHLAAANP